MASIKLTGDTSGEIIISAPAVAGTNTITLPASTGNVFVTYGTAYGLKGITYLTSGTSATYTTPTGVRALYVEVVGGGGGGGGVDGGGAGTAAGGRSGGGGGYCAKFITSPSASYTYTIGAGGTGGAAGNNNGTDGGTTTFTDGTLTLTANGGALGVGQNATAGTNNSIAGGDGGTASGGDLNLSGSMGTDRAIQAGDLAGMSQSGCTPFFGGGKTSGQTGNAPAATNYGEGGAGANVVDTTANYAGADGYQGVIRITEFY